MVWNICLGCGIMMVIWLLWLFSLVMLCGDLLGLVGQVLVILLWLLMKCSDMQLERLVLSNVFFDLNFVWFLLWVMVIGRCELVMFCRKIDDDFCIWIIVICVLNCLEWLCMKCGQNLVLGISLCRLDIIWQLLQMLRVKLFLCVKNVWKLLWVWVLKRIDLVQFLLVLSMLLQEKLLQVIRFLKVFRLICLVRMLFMCMLIVVKLVWLNVVVIFIWLLMFCLWRIVIFGCMFFLMQGVVMLLLMLQLSLIDSLGLFLFSSVLNFCLVQLVLLCRCWIWQLVLFQMCCRMWCWVLQMVLLLQFRLILQLLIGWLIIVMQLLRLVVLNCVRIFGVVFL